MYNWEVPFEECLVHDDTGTILTIEAMLVGTLAALGVVCSVSATRTAIIAEFSDAAGSVQDLNQSYMFNTPIGHSSTVLASEFADQLDFCDDAEDVSGQIENCVVFESPLAEEDGDIEEEKVPSVSGVGLTQFTSVSADGSSGSGSLGDGTTSTGFSLSTNSGGITSVRTPSGFNINESITVEGDYRIEFDDPLVNVEFFISSLLSRGSNRVGNFTITLSDGTVINNAAFTIVPDTISSGISVVGPFTANGGSNRLITRITSGGADYATSNSGGQAAGRLRFADIPTAVGPDCVGVTAIQFEKLGGGDGPSGAGFSVSGQVVTEN